MSRLGHFQTSAFASGMSISGAKPDVRFSGKDKAVVIEPKTDIGSLRSVNGGKADVDPMGSDFRL
jgi:hypothetical protein